MRQLKIYLSPFAYYARLNENEFNEYQKRGEIQKFIDNRKGKLPYEFIEFTSLNNDSGLDFPEKVTKLGLLGSNSLCYHPFGYEKSASTNVFEPTKITFNGENGLHFLFEKEQSSRLRNYEKYYTKKGDPYVSNITFMVDDSGCNLREYVEYSDGKIKKSYYHLISSTVLLRIPEYYALFEFS